MTATTVADVADIVGATDAGRAWLNDAALRQRAARTLPAGITRELWKYTPLKAFLDAFGDADHGTAVVAEHTDQPGIRVVPLGDLRDADRTRVQHAIEDHVDGQRHPLADLALLRASGGWLIEVSGQPERPVELHYPGSGVTPVFVLLEADARLTLIEHVSSSGFLAQVTHADLAPGARLSHYRSALDKDVPHYSLLNVRLQRDAAYQLDQSCVGGARRRAETHVVLDGPGAEAHMTGAYLVETGQHLDQQLVVEHRAGHTVSRQKFHGIGAGKGRSVFNGRIHIHRGAPGSDAALSNRNLALHAEAEMNTKPELEIYTDDVRCAHGATVGQMSGDSLFYLTARGIPEAEARRLLSHGFLRECLSGPQAEAAAEHFMAALS